jgi:hypothetical protein
VGGIFRGKITGPQVLAYFIQAFLSNPWDSGSVQAFSFRIHGIRKV